MEIFGLVDVPLNLLLAIAAAVLVYKYGTRNYDYFKKQGIPGPTPYPIIGSSLSFLIFSKFYSWKQQYGNIFGIFIGKVPALVISDLDILNEVFVKSFNVFRNRMKSIIIPYPFSLSVFYLDNAQWKRVRDIISPTFSSAKLRMMCVAINDCAKTLSNNLSNAAEKKKGVTVKEYFGAYTMDVISRTAFGIKVDSQNEFDNPFVAHAKEMLEQSNMRRLSSMLAGLSTDEIVAQSILFFIAGYETTASTLDFLSYSLATNPDVQEKAHSEIEQELENEPNYDNIKKLKYLDNVITETLRLYPPVIALHRRASETFQIKGLTIPKNQTVLIPTFALQRDPRLFKDPDSFKPERHDEQSNPLSFLAFGHGPRKCLGMRLALVQAKIALVHVLRTVKFERMPDTPVGKVSTVFNPMNHTDD
ncbi:cytochrome P450 3A29-like [Haliotis rufescens]|uniref:cytochrome P450 3A29-like n=1 Tax=Haliotis rufescens TaxID=6454 RepID=UPI00201ED162|nr:cytochrome P450 3A29-like [Haliotis rufescens]